jgi:transposase-like protein
MEKEIGAIEDLKRRIAAERGGSHPKRARFSPQLKADVARFVLKSEMTREQTAKSLGLGKSTLEKWRVRSAKAVKTSKPRARARFKEVRVVKSGPVTARLLELVFPSGARVTGLTVAEVAELVGESR